MNPHEAAGAYPRSAFHRPELISFWQHMSTASTGDSLLAGRTGDGTRKALRGIGVDTGKAGEPIRINLKDVTNSICLAFELDEESFDIKDFSQKALEEISAKKAPAGTPGGVARKSPAMQRQRIWAEASALVSDSPTLTKWISQRTKKFDDLSPADLTAALGHAITSYRAVLGLQSTTSLAVFAAERFGDPHFLDFDRTAGRMLLEILATEQGDALHTVEFSRIRRRLWADYGLLADDVSASIMIAGFRPSGRRPAAVSARAHSDVGEVALLTVAGAVLLDTLWLPDDNKTVIVVENPSIIREAARRLGPLCPPMVCSQGNPDTGSVTSGTWDFLDVLHEQGAELLFHADFDFQGIRLLNSFLGHFDNSKAWLMESEDYLRYANAVPADTAPRISHVRGSSWGDVSKTMNTVGVAVYEESCMEQIIAELQFLARTTSRSRLDRIVDCVV